MLFMFLFLYVFFELCQNVSDSWRLLSWVIRSINIDVGKFSLMRGIIICNFDACSPFCTLVVEQ
jgi:hypothetical protein